MKVIVFGTFDGLHAGHLSYFKQAKKFGDYLIAVVALDKNVLKFKGRLPKFLQNQRLKAVCECGLADEACLGGKNIFDIVAQKKPNVACLGYDQRVDVNELKRKFPDMKIVRLQAYKSKQYKSSLLS